MVEAGTMMTVAPMGVPVLGGGGELPSDADAATASQGITSAIYICISKTSADALVDLPSKRSHLCAWGL